MPPQVTAAANGLWRIFVGAGVAVAGWALLQVYDLGVQVSAMRTTVTAMNAAVHDLQVALNSHLANAYSAGDAEKDYRQRDGRLQAVERALAREEIRLDRLEAEHGNPNERTAGHPQHGGGQ